MFKAQNLSKHRVMYSFEAQREDELTLTEGEIVTVSFNQQLRKLKLL